MVALEILNHLAIWVLNADERFVPIKGKIPVQLTEAVFLLSLKATSLLRVNASLF